MGVTKEVQALLGREGVEGVGRCLEQLVKAPGSSSTYQRLEFREGHLDGIEIRAISRQVMELRAAGDNGLLDATDFVGGEVVAYHQIAWPEFGAEHLANVGQEEFTIHWPID